MAGAGTHPLVARLPRRRVTRIHIARPRHSGSLPDVIGRYIPLPLPVPDWSKPIILALLLLSAGFGIRARVSSVRARRLEHQRQRLTTDLHSMQSALIPEIPSSIGALRISVAYRPADGPAAGGDFYDVFALDGGRVSIILGDVSGHGRDALARAAHMHYTLRAYVEAGLDPRAALKLAGRVQGASDDGLFTTVTIAVYDPRTARLTYATAGHPPPVTFGAADHQPLMSCASPALGWGAPTGRRQTTVAFPKDACACFFSDGLTEARVEDGLLGRDRLAQILSELGPDRSAETVLERVRDHASTIHDDMAACIIEATTGTVAVETRIEELEVDLQQLASGQADSFFAACGVSRHDSAPAIARARGIAAECGIAVLRVALAAQDSTPTVSAPSPGSDTAPEMWTEAQGEARSVLQRRP